MITDQSLLQIILEGNVNEALLLLKQLKNTTGISPSDVIDASEFLVNSNNIQHAQAFLEVALQKWPNSTELQYLFGRLMLNTGKIEKACENLRLASQNESKRYPQEDRLLEYAVALNRTNKLEATNAVMQRLAVECSDNKYAWLNIGFFQSKAGQHEKARQSYKNALKIDNTFVEAIYLYSRAGKLNTNDEVFIQAKKLLDTTLTDDELSKLHFVLAKAYDNDKEYKNAFFHYSKGNNLKGLNFNVNEHRKLIDKYIQFFSSHKFSIPVKEEVDHPRIIFIIGMPRSGTSLLEQILGSHSLIKPYGELPFVRKIVYSAEQHFSTQYPEFMLMLDESIIHQMQNAYFSLFNEKVDTLYLSDKMPANYKHLGFLSVLFPNAKFVYCQRNLLDVGLSNFQQNFESSLSYTTHLEWLGEYMVDFSRLMQFWGKYLGERLYQIEYELLVKDPEQQLKKLFSYLEIPWEPNCLQYEKHKNLVNTASHYQVRQALYESSINKWKNYELQLMPLVNILQKNNII